MNGGSNRGASTPQGTTRGSPRRSEQQETTRRRRRGESRRQQELEGGGQPARGDSNMPRDRRGGPRQRTLGDFFPTTTAQQRESQVRRDFKNAKRKAVARHQQEEKKIEQAARNGPDAFHRQERTFSCVTLNVNGFGNRDAHRTDIFAALRHEDAHGRHDVVCLQETHVDADAIDYNRRLHARTWGFRSTDDSEPLSFWAPSTDKKGGGCYPHRSIWPTQRRTTQPTSCVV